MRYRDATTLHNGDEVIVKKTGSTMMVLDVEKHIEPKEVIVLLDDGNEYHHTEIK